MMRYVLGIMAALTLAAAPALADEKRVLFIAGGPSHGFASHEHAGGSTLLAETLNDAAIGVRADVVTGGWPSDASVFEDVDTVVIYSDGGGGHPAMAHRDKLGELMDRGIGLVCIHYAVEVPEGEPGDQFLDWLGGYFETHWSVNPHWTAEFEALPEHPITTGVQPFSIRDEWYYHMRFRPDMDGVTPILTAMPPAETLDRPEGGHSNNPHVQEAVLEREEPQHTAWAYERPDGGRSFGFTGGHYHWNWGHDDFRRLVANAIVWSAGAEVPAGGVPIEPVTVARLAELTDDGPPANFDPRPIQQQLDEGNRRETPTPLPLRPALGGDEAAPAFSSDTVSTDTPGHAVDIEVDLEGTRFLTLEVDDAGDGFGCDWANWMEPRLIDADGNATRLTELEWQSADSGWGSVNIDRNTDGGPLRVAGEDVDFGIGTHANSFIVYELPDGHDYVRFTAQGGLDNGGTDQGCGSTVRFRVYVVDEVTTGASIRNSRDPEHAVAQLDVAEGLELSLFVSEPMITNPTNIDIDHRGRVWIADAQNYRGRQGTREEGDRILILEDTTGDGMADEVTTFYQGSDIDSALGVTVLGSKVIVSASPYVFIFHDDTGDDKADRKEVLFSNTGVRQHDHSAHAFVFGPDGKLYWNFGDTGRHVHDADGNIIVDTAGNEVREDGDPYRKGMAFRMDPDGSNFEVLGHNFRNPYELTVDSFGNVWQSDNDDDGNRACRIQFIMEYGNFGYTDELTGAGWNHDGRLGRHPEVPHRHWHVRDPGVVPNLAVTGAGSPSGITFYEGDLLPDVFHGQMIHADPGAPQAVWAFPTIKHGAGFQTVQVDMVHGARDSWFRPVDVNVAPDGSVFVADWYDPGVGGHAMGDVEKGRIFRIAPAGHEYSVPEFDFDTIDGAIEALKNPNFAARYLAWTALHERGGEAEEALVEMFEDEQPHLRARALWLLSKIEGGGIGHIERALADADADIRITALRAARQLDGAEVLAYVRQLADDPSPQVRREAAIALRHDDSEEAAELWAELAERHEAGDRWYVEALGIAADRQWERFFAAYLDRVGDGWDTPAGREIVWRARAPRAADLLRQVIVDPQVSAYRRPQLVRALDFHEADVRRETLVALLAADQPDVVELALSQLGSLDAPEVQQAVAGVLERAEPGLFARLVGEFDVRDRADDLQRIVASGDPAATEAAAVLVRWGDLSRLGGALAQAEPQHLPAVLQALGATSDDRVFGLLEALIVDGDRPRALRGEAVTALGRTQPGQRRLLQMVDEDRLPESVHFAAANILHTSGDRAIRDQAAELLSFPETADAEGLPPVAELAQQRGDVERGQQAYNRLCLACHQVDGVGIDFGPNLSEIGDKFSREGMLVAVIDPNAGISFNYRGVRITTDDGRELLGFIHSETAEAVTLRMLGGVNINIPRDEIAQRTELDESLMPANLAAQMSQEELVDLIEYLMTLRRD